MSALRQSVMLARSRGVLAVARPLRVQRSFGTTVRLAVGKESSLHNEGRKEEIERAHKKKEEPEWQEDLASDSESITKADRGDFADSAETIAQLEKETAKLAEEGRIDDLEKLKTK